MSGTFLPPGCYRVLIHGLKKEGGGVFLHATTLPGGERLRLRVFDKQIRKLMNACAYQRGLPDNLKGGQVLLHLAIHPEFGNRLVASAPVAEVIPVESDVEIDRPVKYAEFDHL